MVGNTISHYKILEKLGERASGTVYKAQDTKRDRLVALMFLPIRQKLSESDTVKLKQDATSAALLAHPCICAFYSLKVEKNDYFVVMEFVDGQDLERMVESGKATTAHFGSHITYINVLKNISVDCDCDAHGAKPTCNDIGILGSQDILAIDKASVDLVYSQPELQRHDMVERIQSRSGLHQLEYMKALRMGSDRYELVRL